MLTSPTVSGTPACVKDPDAPEGVLESAIAASIASVGDRITLSVGADEVKKLARPIVGEPGPAHSR